MLLNFLVLLVLSYVLFFFISELTNPFIIVKAPLKRRRWRLGRAAAFASLVAGTTVLILSELGYIDLKTAVVTYMALGALLVVPAAVKHMRSALWQ